MSGLFASLRKEAERVSASNKIVLFQTNQRQGRNAVDQFSGHSARSKLGVGGLGLGAGSLMGLMGVAAANQAAALGSAGLLASASTALAGLGTVTLGAAILPAATVATLGGAVAGVAIFGVSRLMKVDISRGINLQQALEQGNETRFQKLSNESLTMKDWFSGAKNLLVDAFQRDRQKSLELTTHKGLRENDAPINQEKTNLALEYELIDLFGSSPEKDQIMKNDLVSQLSARLWDNRNIVVTEDKIKSFFENSRGNESNFGKILGIDKEQGLVIQSIGRGQATIHKLQDFDITPKIGSEMMISYRGGKMMAPQEKNLDKNNALER